MDIGDVCGANLWDIHAGTWNEDLLALCAGSKDAVAELKQKLGHVDEDGGISFGAISPYFTQKYGFSKECQVIAATGDNPSTILSLPLREGDAMVSLGTSTTFLMSTPKYIPDPAYHFMNHPTTAGLYMFMLCYKNGGLAREKVRDKLNGSGEDKSWDKFNDIATKSAPLNQKDDKTPMKLGLFFPLPEIVPNVQAGTWRYLYNPSSDELSPAGKDWSNGDETDARAIVESQFLSLRLRSQNLVSAQKSSTGVELPPQPRRIYLVGGGSQNSAIASICADVLGSAEGVFRLDIGGNACALGAAYKAVWGCERKKGEKFEELIGSRWDEDKFVKKICDGYRNGVFEKYGEALKGFGDMERKVLDEVAGRAGDEKINSRPDGSGE
jgi:xylulokinase